MNVGFLNELFIIVGVVLFCIFLILFIIRKIYGKSLIFDMMVYILISMLAIIILAFLLGKLGITLLNLSIALVLGLATITFLVNALNRYIVKPLKQIRTVACQIADVDLKTLQKTTSELATGNLMARLEIQAEAISLNSRNEIGDLATEFNEMILELQKTGEAFKNMSKSFQGVIGKLNQSAYELGEASSQLANAAQHTDGVASQIGLSIQQVAKSTAQQTDSITRTASFVEKMTRSIDGVARGAQEQAHSVGTASQISSQISASIRQVASNAGEVVRSAASAAALAQEGSRTVQETIQDMESIREKVKISADKVREMEVRSTKIESIAETIEDISTQTNLLALNAAIEAARAGEHGKGFAVVATEVRKLADRATGQTNEIRAIVKSIRETIIEATGAMEAVDNEVEAGVLKSDQSGVALGKILEAVETVNTRASGTTRAAGEISAAVDKMVSSMDSVSAVVEENTATTEQMSANSAEVNQAIENIASISEQNSAASEEVSAASEELSSQAQQVSNLATALKALAEQLNTQVKQFKL